MPLERLEDLDLPLDLTLLHRLEHLDDHGLVLVHEHPSIDL